jgi:1-deoxy-D-xylulose-5-phosphate reductoisomerase
MTKQRLTLLGATGSVGCSTLDLIKRDIDRFEVVALTANNNVEGLAREALAVGARRAVIANPSCYQALKERLKGSGIEVAAGAEALVEAAQLPTDWIMAAIIGAAGLPATLAGVGQGVRVAIANKESLVCAGPLIKRLAAKTGATLLPVDSEHNAIFQVFDFQNPEKVARVILTASGGPFRTFSIQQMQHVSVQQALCHPTWSMGAKISIDSATLMNKGLELIEALQLFPLHPDQIEVIIHPESIIHSMVEYVDGSMLAQLGSPDMRIPIAYTLAYPGRMATPATRLDLAKLKSLHFEAPDLERFPCLRLAWHALRAGDAAPAQLNAANEVAVAAFLQAQIGFQDIAVVVEEALNSLTNVPLTMLEDVLAVDSQARRIASAIVQTRKAP